MNKEYLQQQHYLWTLIPHENADEQKLFANVYVMMLSINQQKHKTKTSEDL